LFLGTQSENIFDAVAKRRHFQSKKTHCKRGHIFDDENTYYHHGGKHRNCRQCRRDFQNRNNHKNKKYDKV